MQPAYSLALDDAKDALDAAEAKASELGVAMNLAAVNQEGNLLGFRRMDGAKLVAASIARDKAYTAAAVKKPTAALKEGSEPGGDVYGLQSTDDNRVVTFGGGLPVERDGAVVGAVGASGGAVEEDVAVAGAAVDHLDESL